MRKKQGPEVYPSDDQRTELRACSSIAKRSNHEVSFSLNSQTTLSLTLCCIGLICVRHGTNRSRSNSNTLSVTTISNEDQESREVESVVVKTERDATFRHAAKTIQKIFKQI